MAAMKVAAKIGRAVAVSLLFAVWALAAPAGKACMLMQDHKGNEGGPPWKELERELAARGISTDTDSLLRLAGSTASIDLRWEAVELLGLRHEQRARETLWKLAIGDPSRLVQQTAALAVARLGDERGVELLRSSLGTEEDPQRKLFLAARLAELGDPSGYGAVVAAARSADAHLRLLSAGALVPFLRWRGKLSGPDPEDLLLALAHDPSRDVRYELLVELPLAVNGGLAAAKAMAAAEQMERSDADSGVREKAHLLLVLLAPSPPPRGR
jgi:HEAT repeat protein